MSGLWAAFKDGFMGAISLYFEPLHPSFWRSLLYRPVMKLAHRFHWHYAPPIYPDGDTMLWCKWCGFRQVVQRRDYKPAISTGEKQVRRDPCQPVVK